MNLTQETNDYFSTTSTSGETKINPTVINWPKEKKPVTRIYPTPDQILEDKLKTTPSAGLTKISKIFTIDWKKLTNFFGFR